MTIEKNLHVVVSHSAPKFSLFASTYSKSSLTTTASPPPAGTNVSIQCAYRFIINIRLRSLLLLLLLHRRQRLLRRLRIEIFSRFSHDEYNFSRILKRLCSALQRFLITLLIALHSSQCPSAFAPSTRTARINDRQAMLLLLLTDQSCHEDMVDPRAG
jgi:hypothetical protein